MTEAQLMRMVCSMTMYVCILCTQQHLVASQLRLFVRNQHHGNCQLAAFHHTTYPCCQPSTDGMGCNKRYHMAYTLQRISHPTARYSIARCRLPCRRRSSMCTSLWLRAQPLVVAVAAAAAVEVVAAVAGLFAWIDVNKNQLTVTVEVDQNTQTVKQRVGFASA